MTLARPRPRPVYARGHFKELRAGKLGVRIAATAEEVEAAQALRYRVFFDEMGARPNAAAAATGRDADRFDPGADHMLVLDHARGEGAAGVVGTYRLIQREAAAATGGFYSAHEYELSRIDAFPGRVLELGRSCVDAAYRGRAVMQLLWRGIAAYVAAQEIELMFGCASLPGTDPDALGEVLTYLYQHHLAPPALRLRALPDRYVEMQRRDPATVDMRRANLMLPPLIKGYLRLGGFVGDGAVVDREFNTTDVAIIVKTDLITDKYVKHYERDGLDRPE
ncbi:MAG: GNAT family N-acetyltransferase [Janthinobacterium lividum]